MRTLLLFAAAALAYGQAHSQTVAVKGLDAKEDFGAKGDGLADDTAALQRAFNAACAGAGRLSVPKGKFNISAPLVAGCALFLQGEGPEVTVIFQTVHSSLNNGIVTTWPLTLQDIGIDTLPLTANYGMSAVERPGRGVARGQNFTFTRFHSSGFNFGILISGTGDRDIAGAILVRDCKLSVNTVADAVSQPVNVGNAASLVVEDSTLTGDTNNDHAVYTIAVRNIAIRNNLISGHGNSAIKMLTGGFRSPACPAVNNDYTAWSVTGNVIADSKLALAAYAYCGMQLPELTIADNRIARIANTYAGDAAAIYIQANCQSTIQRVSQRGNVFENIGLSGVYLLSSVQGGAPCADLSAEGTIDSFTSSGEKYTNWSVSYPGAYYAISAQAGSQAHLRRVSVSKLSVDGKGNGRAALNLSAFQEVTVSDKVEINLARASSSPTSSSPSSTAPRAAPDIP